MESICVKLKQREKDKYRKLLSVDDSLYSFLPIDEHSVLPYSPGSLLEDGEWFCISDASKKGYSIDIISTEFDSVDFRNLERKEFKKIDFLFAMSENYIFFQNVSKSKLISKRSILALGEEFRYQSECCEIVINDNPDAIYNKITDTLFFKRLESITSIFKGIDQIYREATEEETTQFLNNDFINLKNGYSSLSVKTPNRKRIALAMQTLNKLSDGDKENIFSYIGDYCPELKVSENSFDIGSEDDMKKLLFGIEQRFYTTPVGGEKRIANSIITLRG